MRAPILCTALVLCLSACIVEAPGQAERRGPAPATVVTNVPPLDVRNGANLENKIEIVGARLDPGRALPGESVKVTTYLKVLEPLDQDYLIFVHVEDPDGRVQRMNYDHPPQPGPTSQWQKGQTLQDSFVVQVPPGAGLRSLNVWLGFWHAPTDTRLKLSNPQAVRNDGSNRILLATIPVAQ